MPVLGGSFPKTGEQVRELGTVHRDSATDPRDAESNGFSAPVGEAGGSGGTRALAAFAGQRVHGVAAIGNPARFFDSLRAHGLDVIEHAFADHHAYVADELAFGDERAVLMTEKDAVKCIGFAGPQMWCVPVRADLPDDFFDAVAARLRRH